MTAIEKFEALVRSFPKIESDFDADDKVTKEAIQRVIDWAWEQMTKEEHVAFEQEVRFEEAERIFDQAVAKGRIEVFTNEAGVTCYRDGRKKS